jgi:ribosomal protein S18 acetylase RimI-like enzyme
MHNISYSEIESKRFGYRIFRGMINELNAEELKELILNNSVDITIVRIKSETKAFHHLISSLGFDYIHADTLVYHKADLTKIRVNSLNNNVEYVKIDSSNINILKEIVPSIFEGYQNHYFSNPFIDKKEIQEGYTDWASSFLREEEGKISWYLKIEGHISGFVTCSFDKSASFGEIVFGGILPQFSGHGLYSDFIRHCQLFFQRMGLKEVLVSTQTQNYAVQKVWAREGFRMSHSYETYHINSFLDFSLTAKSASEFIFKEEPKSRNSGFQNLALENYISGYFKTTFKEKRERYSLIKNMFIRTMKEGSKYNIIFSTINSVVGGSNILIGKCIDKEGNICFLTYRTLS